MVGIGIAAMHYMGMASLSEPAEIVWMPDLVVVSGPARHLLRRGYPPGRDAEPNLSGLRRRRRTAHACDHFASFRRHGRGRPPPSIRQRAHRNPAAAGDPGRVDCRRDGNAGDRRLDRRNLDRRPTPVSHPQHAARCGAQQYGQGLCMFGADSRLQLWNESYLRMYRLLPSRSAPGLLSRPDARSPQDGGNDLQGISDQHSAKLKSDNRDHARPPVGSTSSSTVGSST